MPRTVMSLVILGSALVLVGRSANADSNSDLRFLALWQRLLHMGLCARYDGLRHQESLDDRSR
jgi:hypothetical protein